MELQLRRTFDRRIAFATIREKNDERDCPQVDYHAPLTLTISLVSLDCDYKSADQGHLFICSAVFLCADACMCNIICLCLYVTVT